MSHFGVDDAVTVAPQFHKIVFANESVRVLEVVVPAGAKTKMHWHPKNIFYPLSDGTLRITKQDGSTTDVPLVSGTIKNNEEGMHMVENAGQEPIAGLQIEFLQP